MRQIAHCVLSKVSKQGVVRSVKEKAKDLFHELAMHKEFQIEEGHTEGDHMLISMQPNYWVSQVMGYIKGKGRFTWPRCTETGKRTLLSKISALGPTLHRLWVAIMKSFATTFDIKRR
jgi:REP element-mobilizing transposase RayT